MFQKLKLTAQRQHSTKNSMYFMFHLYSFQPDIKKKSFHLHNPHDL